MNASVIICTRNRANSLAGTLEAFTAVKAPAGIDAEIVVVDNGSTDHTAEVVRKYAASRIPVRHVLEASPGLSRARNAGLAASQSKIILFTDDDVVPSPDWMEQIVGPLVRRECDGVVGRVELAKEVSRPWMTRQHKICLAVYEGPDFHPLQLIGANMGFHRSVLDRIPQFDTELGAGALGFAEEALFSWQMEQAGLHLKYVPEASVVHYPDPSRLNRSSWLSIGRRHGATNAYLLHHWFHGNMRSPRLRHLYVALKLRLRRLLDPPQAMNAEGAASWEISYVGEMEKCRRFLTECRRPRNYSKRGLRKRVP